LEYPKHMLIKSLKKLNEQLNKNGFMTVTGKVSRRYFEEKFYGVAA